MGAGLMPRPKRKWQVGRFLSWQDVARVLAENPPRYIAVLFARNRFAVIEGGSPRGRLRLMRTDAPGYDLRQKELHNARVDTPTFVRLCQKRALRVRVRVDRNSGRTLVLSYDHLTRSYLHKGERHPGSADLPTLPGGIP